MLLFWLQVVKSKWTQRVSMVALVLFLLVLLGFGLLRLSDHLNWREAQKRLLREREMLERRRRMGYG